MIPHICVVSTNRADLGLLAPLIRAAELSPDFDLTLLAMGEHFSRERGYSYSEIQELHLEKVVAAPIFISSGTPTGMINYFSAISQEAGRYLQQIAPDAVVVLGDRIEILGVAVCALTLGTPLVHISGGEVTRGAIDDEIRNSISMIASVHLVAELKHAERLRCLGRSENVAVVGRPVQDVISALEPTSRSSIDAWLGMKTKGHFFLVTLHPETRDHVNAQMMAETLVEALSHFPEASVIFTGANIDAGGREIENVLRRSSSAQPDKWTYIPSLGSHRYLQVMKHASCVIGNSSSGVVEAPLMGKPVVNIGRRQEGRETHDLIFNASFSVDDIRAKIELALNSPEFSPQLAQAGCQGKPVATAMLKVIHDFITSA